MESHGYKNHETYLVALNLMNNEDEYHIWLNEARICLEKACGSIPVATRDLATRIQTAFINQGGMAVDDKSCVLRDLMSYSLAQVDFTKVAKGFIEEILEEVS